MLRNKVTSNQKRIMAFIRREFNRTMKYNKLPGYITAELLEGYDFPLNSVPTDFRRDELWVLLALGLAQGAYMHGGAE